MIVEATQSELLEYLYSLKREFTRNNWEIYPSDNPGISFSVPGRKGNFLLIVTGTGITDLLLGVRAEKPLIAEIFSQRHMNYFQKILGSYRVEYVECTEK